MPSLVGRGVEENAYFVAELLHVPGRIADGSRSLDVLGRRLEDPEGNVLVVRHKDRLSRRISVSAGHRRGRRTFHSQR